MQSNRQRLQNLRQGLWAHLGRSASATGQGRQPDLFPRVHCACPCIARLSQFSRNALRDRSIIGSGSWRVKPARAGCARAAGWIAGEKRDMSESITYHLTPAEVWTAQAGGE